MADLEPLIRYRKHGLDEKQRFIAELYRAFEKLEMQRQVIDDQMELEIKLGEEMGSAEAQAYLGKYLEGARMKIKALENSMRKMDARIAAAQEDMRNAFAEMKKVEITQERREAEEKSEEKKKEDQELDEIALDSYRRKIEEE